MAKKMGPCAVCRVVKVLVRGSGMCASCFKLRQGKRGR